MNNKPRVFLSHSKIDKEFIERIEQDLKKCRIEAWYDDWEISPGKSLRNKIFEEGISDCDAIFVYLTPDSIKSSWVNRELDAAFIEQNKEKNTEILPFVSNKDLIKTLPPDIAAIKCPTLNNENYDEGLRILITAIYEAKISSILKKRELESENKILRLEITIAELKLALSNSSKDTYTDLQYIEKSLEKIIFKSEDIHLSALKFFEKLWPSFANGAAYESPDRLVRLMSKNLFTFSEVIPPFRIRNLVEEKTFNDLETGEQYLIYSLTDTGRQFATYITKDGYTFNKSKPKSVLQKKS